MEIEFSSLGVAYRIETVGGNPHIVPLKTDMPFVLNRTTGVIHHTRTGSCFHKDGIKRRVYLDNLPPSPPKGVYECGFCTGKVRLIGNDGQVQEGVG